MDDRKAEPGAMHISARGDVACGVKGFKYIFNTGFWNAGAVVLSRHDAITRTIIFSHLHVNTGRTFHTSVVDCIVQQLPQAQVLLTYDKYDVGATLFNIEFELNTFGRLRGAKLLS